MFRDSLKQKCFFTILLLSHCMATEQPISGLIGGREVLPSAGFAGTVSPFTGVTQLDTPTAATVFRSVALNNSGLGLIGGVTNNRLYAAFVSSTHGVQNIPFPTDTTSVLQSVAINSKGLGLVGGDLINSAYAAFVSPTSLSPTPLTNLPAIDSVIRAVALNDLGHGLIGGNANLGIPYAAFVSSSSTVATEIPLNLAIGSEITSVAINASDLGLIGGRGSSNTPFAAFIINSTSLPIDIDSAFGTIFSVALNNSGSGLIGGDTESENAYAAFVFRNAAPQVITGLPATGLITTVAINSSSQGLIGGTDLITNKMYAAFVSIGKAPQVLAGLPTGSIDTVAINDFNQGLIAGSDPITSAAYAAIISPSGVVTPLTLGFSQGDLNSVAINAFFLSQIPTQGLNGNNVTFANYINENAPQDAFYFVPSAVDGSLASALESAAPTRNMISYNTVMQNSFYVTTNLSAHLRNQRLINARALQQGSKNATVQLDIEENAEDEFLTSRCLQTPKKSKTTCTKAHCVQACPPKKMGVWVDVIGALAYQNAQHETPGFDPETLGGTIGFDGKISDTFTIGGGGSYFYTHVHEKQTQGHSNIQQEDLFVYGSWQPKNFYVDVGIWGGLFQTKQTRHITMTGFDFKSSSTPHGWQCVPHLEIGFLSTAYCTPNMQITWNLLGMADWANAWQNKYKEKGSGPFNVKQKSHYGSLLRLEGGLRCSETIFYKTWNLIFQEKGSYVNIQSYKAGKMQAFLIGSPGSFTVQTLTHAQNLGVVQFSITAAPYTCCLPTSMLLYQGEFGSGYQSHQMTLECNWNF